MNKENLIFCMMSECVYYFEDNCFDSSIVDNRVPLNENNSYDKCKNNCKKYMCGEHELYKEEWK